jgi:hypothetical protein
MKFIFTSIFIIFQISGCVTVKSSTKEGKAVLRTYFYDDDGNHRFADTLQLWFKDSMAIQDKHTTEIETRNTSKKSVTTIKMNLLGYRFINLQRMSWYDYATFSDTALTIDKGILPEFGFKDYGWNFYSDKVLQIQGEAMPIRDTTIESIRYKRVKFNVMGDDPQKVYKVGYLRCDKKEHLFSLLSSYSRLLKCTMTKLFTYRVGSTKPFSLIEIEFISDQLTKDEEKVFAAWERNAKQNPVKQ